jgi:hypothetical protein
MGLQAYGSTLQFAENFSEAIQHATIWLGCLLSAQVAAADAQSGE